MAILPSGHNSCFEKDSAEISGSDVVQADCRAASSLLLFFIGD
jgi:hypothetical protein